MRCEQRTQTVGWTSRDPASRAPSEIDDAASTATERLGSGLVHMDRYTGRPRTEWAFTLIELVIVVLIIGIGAALAVPMMSSASGMQIRAAGAMVSADLEYAKSMAISRGQRYAVVFNAAGETYEIRDPNNTVIEHPVKKGFNYQIDFANDGRLDRVDLVSANFDGTNTVKFDYLGSPYNGADGNLNTGTITLRAGNRTKTVTIEPVTGFISVN